MDRQRFKLLFAPLGVAFGVTLFVTLLLLASNYLHIPHISRLVRPVPAVVVRLLGLAMIGVWLPIFLAGFLRLGRQGAVGQSESLRTEGVYACVRNPMYSGVSFTLLGCGLALDSTGVAAAGLWWLFITYVQCRREEKELAERFGVQYLEYKRRTPRYLPNPRSLTTLLRSRPR